jgi:hypothetical protein
MLKVLSRNANTPLRLIVPYSLRDNKIRSWPIHLLDRRVVAETVRAGEVAMLTGPVPQRPFGLVSVENIQLHHDSSFDVPTRVWGASQLVAVTRTCLRASQIAVLAPISRSFES